MLAPNTHSAASDPVAERSVQDYIDERPVWIDGTRAPFTPMTRMQWRIWMLATAGKFFEGLVVFMTGVALPLIADEFGLSAADKGFVTAASLAGILVGASALGGLSDTFGRKRMFIVEMILFTLFLTALPLAPNVPMLVLCLFGVGLALGCDYPTAHLVISESIPSTVRGRLVLSAFAFQAVGALVGSVLGYTILTQDASTGAWRWMYASAILPAVVVVIGRFFITDSPHWLLSRGRVEEAERATHRLLERHPRYPKSIRLARPGNDGEARAPKGYGALFSPKHRKATILASVPWFLQDLSTYGIGIFTPTILVAVLGGETGGEGLSAVIHHDLLAAKGSALMDLLFVVGILVAITLVDKVGRIRLQLVGFVGCALGLLLATLSIRADGGHHMPLLFAGFMLFFFMTNLGPNAMTYLIAGEVFPTRVRGLGAGFAASFAKIGAVLTAFLFPILLKTVGTAALLYCLVGASLLGAVVTFVFAIETRGISLETIGQPVTRKQIKKARKADADIA